MTTTLRIESNQNRASAPRTTKVCTTNISLEHDMHFAALGKTSLKHFSILVQRFNNMNVTTGATDYYELSYEFIFLPRMWFTINIKGT